MLCCRRFKRMVPVVLVLLFMCIYKFYYDTTSKMPGVITEEYYPQESLDAVEYIRMDCGKLCETNAKGVPGPYFDQITVPIDCQALFKSEHIDRGHGLSIAPKTIPKDLHMDFTMNNRLKVSPWYFNDEEYLGKTAKLAVWTEQIIEDYISLAKDNKLKGTYGVSETNALRDGLKHAPGIINGRVLVIGSEIPWVEACALEAGAREVVTLEYGKIVSKHPKIKTMVPVKFRKSYLNKTLGSFDAIVTFSSIEHSGLGRYGDGLNPWGDIIAVARGWCVTKEGGSLTIGVQYSYERDYIKFNAARWYGKIRYPYLTTNWKQHYRGYGHQRVHVFTKINVNFTRQLDHYKLKEPHPYFPLNNTDKHYSQAHQDETVYQISRKKNGIFVEMGAYNGEMYSNTLWLERKHNWTGLLIEANPDLCRQIDALKRRAWRLCACISDKLKKTEFIQSGAVGGMASELDDDQMKMVKTNRTISVPCFNMIEILDLIGVQHIDYFSLDVEGSEMIILESVRNELISGKIVVNIWSIEYRTWDGTKNIVNKSFQKLQNLRNFFENIGGYVEYSQLNNEHGDNRDGMALDVVFVRT
ncbi:uncharacterized protein LOC127707988 [Mytilus californianus]|uniref:uncharacterized protein LOC127707988 n=1 Tax=Mytilus californianus TaxID=6549 RepID=UPI002247F585|nr:uncharacterized protein LOC127707988 [Mytilus californianus]XP_052068725.1 uncharacterized protein LOC127707988 [Mytilus californianus]